MGLFKRFFDRWVIKSQRREMQSFVDGLAAMDGQEIGLLLANATHLRNKLTVEGFRLMDPIVDFVNDPTVTLRLGAIIREFQRLGAMTDSAAAMVWLHTMRVGGQHALRPCAREMWRQLSRGMPYVPTVSVEIFRMTGEFPQIQGNSEFPAGLTPDPL